MNVRRPNQCIYLFSSTLDLRYILLLADLHFYCIARESDTTTAPLHHRCSFSLSFIDASLFTMIVASLRGC